MQEKTFEIDFHKAKPDPFNSYTSKQQFQAYITGILSKIPYNHLLDLQDNLIDFSKPIVIRNRGNENDQIQEVLVIYQSPENQKYNFEVRRYKYGHCHIWRGEQTDEEGLKKYIHSALYQGDIDSTVSKIRAERGTLLDNYDAMILALGDIKNRLLIMPRIFKETFLHCIYELEGTAKPLTTLVNDKGLFESALEQAIQFAEGLE